MPKKNDFMLEDISTILKTVGANIRTARLRRNMRIGDLANRIHVDARTIARMEKGDSSTSFKNIIAALTVFGLEHTLDKVAAPELDKEGESLDILKQRKRAVNKEKVIDDDF